MTATTTQTPKSRFFRVAGALSQPEPSTVDLTVSLWFGNRRFTGKVTAVRKDESGAAWFDVDAGTAKFEFVPAVTVTVEDRTVR